MCDYRDKKARRAEKQKGKGGKKEEESSKSSHQGSPDQDGEYTATEPPLEVGVELHPRNETAPVFRLLQNFFCLSLHRLAPQSVARLEGISNNNYCVTQNGDEDWSVDTSEAAVKARSENLSEHISTLTLTKDIELTPSQRLDKFFKYVDVS